MKKYYVIALTVASAVLFSCCGSSKKTKASEGTESLVVASTMVDCMGVGLQRCLLVKPEGEKEWQFFYNSIEGFDYQPGYEYVISVYKETVSGPPADASSLKYVLDKVLSKEKKTSAGIPDTSHITGQ